MNDEDATTASVTTERHCDCYVHKQTRFVSKIVESAAARRSSLCPLLGLTTMATPQRPRVTSAEHKVPHRKFEDEKVIEELYKFGSKLGQGSFGIVLEAENQDSGVRWAIKKVNKEKAGRSAITLLEREVSILKKVKHEHIIQLEEVLETTRKVYLVMELCELGELRSLLFSKGPFSEASARYIISCLTDAIVYLHKMGIVHRDLKLENILIAGCRKENEDDHPLYDIKLTDFGLSVEKGVGADSMLQSSCGTPVYMAPEVIRNQAYSQQCDIWSVGVIQYALLSQEFPFMADKEERLFELIKRGEIRFVKPVWTSVSEAAKSVIRQLLDIDPAHRITATELASHWWTRGTADSGASNTTNVLDMMRDFLKETSLNPEANDDFDESDGIRDIIDEDPKRPESSGAQSSGSSGPENASRPVKRKDTLSAPGTQFNHVNQRHSPGTPANQISTSRRCSLPVTAPRKALGPPTKIHDNKTSRQISPISGSSRTKSAKSPIQNKSDRRDNGKGIHATDHGIFPPQSNANSRLKTDTSGRHLSANRPVTPGTDHSSMGQAVNPSNIGSPLNTPRFQHGGSANKARKKKIPSSERRKEENHPKR